MVIKPAVPKSAPRDVERTHRVKGFIQSTKQGTLQRSVTVLGEREAVEVVGGPQCGGVGVGAVVDGLKGDFANAVIVMPPKELWGAVQAIREKHDPAYQRWMPHINMLWPFAADDHQRCADALADNLRDFEPFELYFNSFDSFAKGTVFLKPTTASGEPLPQLQQLRDVLHRTFPELVREGGEVFSPHLTVAKLGDGEKKKFLATQKWEPMSFTVKELYVISRPDKETPFSVKAVVPLKGGPSAAATMM